MAASARLQLLRLLILAIVLTSSLFSLHLIRKVELETTAFASKIDDHALLVPVPKNRTEPLRSGGTPQPQSAPQQTNNLSRRMISVKNRSITATPSMAPPSTTRTSTGSPLDQLKVPHPIFHASLPKSGTTSTARYFYCGKIWTAHTFANTIGTTHTKKQMRVGHCYLENVQAGRPPLFDCGRYKVWSDMGHPRGTPCFYPSVHGLDAFYEHYPNATILLVTRNSTAWSKSVLQWKNGELLKKWGRCQHFPKQKATEDDLRRFYEWHAQNIRDFVSERPSLTYVEVALEDEAIGQKLEDAIGVNASCLGHHNSHEKRMRLNPKFRQEYLAEQARLNATKRDNT